MRKDKGSVLSPLPQVIFQGRALAGRPRKQDEPSFFEQFSDRLVYIRRKALIILALAELIQILRPLHNDVAKFPRPAVQIDTGHRASFSKEQVGKCRKEAAR